MPEQTTNEPLTSLAASGVSIWLDDLSRERLATGNLAKLIDERNVVGVTTNPTIFQKALANGTAYEDQIRDLALRDVTVEEAVRALTTFDVRWACDLLAPLHASTDGEDGRVSIEVDPRMANDAERTVAEARALAWLVDRPNVLIKIPATQEGLDAITRTIAEGISVNVTLIFSLDRYRAVIDAYLAGLERARDAGLDLSTIRSVASFFVSRVDTEIDSQLDALGTPEADQLRGKAAIANARLAYDLHGEVLQSERWRSLAADGATMQRPLWASTGVKDPAYDDTRYVVDLVGPDTVNTMPEATLDAVADHGEVRGDTLTPEVDEAREVLATLQRVGIDYDDVVHGLELDGVRKFAASWDELLEGVRVALEEARP